MSEEKTIKQQIEDKKKSLEKKPIGDLLKKKSLEKDEEELVDTTKQEEEMDRNESFDSLSKLSTDEIFDYLEERVNDERAELIIEKAQEEYKELKERITEKKARKAVGGLLVDIVSSKLAAARSVGSIPVTNR